MTKEVFEQIQEGLSEALTVARREKATVTDEMVEAAETAYWDRSNDPEGSRDMHAALTAALTVAQAETQPVAWLHPRANWSDTDFDVVRRHCLNDGPMPIPLFASPVPAKREPVAVKPLVWERWPQDGSSIFEGIEPKRKYVARALTPFGAIFLMSKNAVEFTLVASGAQKTDGGSYKCADAAKAAAQSDYERRVLSALSTSSTPADGEDNPAPVPHLVPVPALWAECAYCKEVGEEECLHPVAELRWNGEQWCCEECGSGEEPDAWQAAPQIAIPSPQTRVLPTTPSKEGSTDE